MDLGSSIMSERSADLSRVCRCRTPKKTVNMFNDLFQHLVSLSAQPWVPDSPRIMYLASGGSSYMRPKMMIDAALLLLLFMPLRPALGAARMRRVIVDQDTTGPGTTNTASIALLLCDPSVQGAELALDPTTTGLLARSLPHPHSLACH